MDKNERDFQTHRLCCSRCRQGRILCAIAETLYQKTLRILTEIDPQEERQNP